MLSKYSLLTTLLTLSWLLHAAHAQLHPATPARYIRLPSLREQASILDGWRDERLANVPALLRKYSVDAWLVRLSFDLLY